MICLVSMQQVADSMRPAALAEAHILHKAQGTVLAPGNAPSLEEEEDSDWQWSWCLRVGAPPDHAKTSTRSSMYA